MRNMGATCSAWRERTKSRTILQAEDIVVPGSVVKHLELSRQLKCHGVPAEGEFDDKQLVLCARRQTVSHAQLETSQPV